MVTNRAAMKCCPRCNAQDPTEFSKCRYCGTRYDARTKRPAGAWLTANLNYAAPMRRLVGHVLDGIIGTLIVGVVWIGLCLTGALAIAQATVNHSNVDGGLTTANVGLVQPKPDSTSSSPDASSSNQFSYLNGPQVQGTAVDKLPKRKNGATSSKTNERSNKHSRSPAAISNGRSQPAETESQVKVARLPMQDLVGDWLPGYDGKGLNPSLQFPVLLFTALWYVLMWLYTASFQAGRWQATPGQSLVGCKVTDIWGDRITFTRASVRYFTSLISNFVGFLGYITVFCTMRKQTLHDMLSGCIVLRR